MDSSVARKIYYSHANAMAYVDVETKQGDRAIGTAFHVGDGVFVTARHVVENKIVEIKITEEIPIRANEFFRGIVPEEIIERNDEALKEILGHYPYYKYWDKPLEIESGPFFHKNKNIDIAIFKVKKVHANVSVVKLGIHWDDWVYRGFWHLSDSVVLGYPPIPMASEPHLVAAKAQIHTYLIPRHSPHIHFILSGIPRGGFSGGPAFTENGDALGVVISSLTDDHMPAELGYFAVLSIEPIVVCLKEYDLYPQVQQEYHDEILFDKKKDK